MTPTQFASARDRIGQDPLKAWAFIAEDVVVVNSDGPLGDLCGGIKDNIEVAGMPMRAGVSFVHRTPATDAPCVARLRAAGATIVGKTVTTALAFRDPAPSINPWNAARTPGGSSVGSAISVAVRHVDFGLGTQTIGSVLRPAHFCGVVGYKPTYGRVSTAGVLACAHSVDTVGVIARDVTIAERVARAMVPDLAMASAPRRPRLVVDTNLFLDRYGLETQSLLEAFLARAVEHGADLERVDLRALGERAFELLNVIIAYEAVQNLGFARDQSPPSEVAALLERGGAVERSVYEAALREREALRPAVADLFERGDALAVLCAGPAPSRATTGDGAGQAPWTFFGSPSIAVPVALTGEGLPIGIQLVGVAGADAELLALARWCETIAGFTAGPPRIAG